jgi:hypothetical protein
VKPVPAGLESAGKKLWRSVLSVYELAPHELLLLERAARCADRLVKYRRADREDDADCRRVGGSGQAVPLYRQALEADLMLCKLLAELASRRFPRLRAEADPGHQAARHGPPDDPRADAGPRCGLPG